jgi:Flp pilus assembly protein TadD
MDCHSRPPTFCFDTLRLNSAASAAFLVAFTLAGCASTPSPEPSQSTELYDGAPTTVFATEFPVASAEEARQRAEAALAERDLDLALYLYAQAVELDAEDSDSLYRIGAIHAQRGNTAMASHAYGSAIELDPEHALALQGLGLIYMDVRRPEAAEEMLQRAIDADADLWRAHNALGVLADTRSEHVTAIAHYNAALKLRPESASVLNNRGYSEYLSGNWDAAEADFVAATIVDPNYERAWQNLGLLYARQRKYGYALRMMSRVMEQHVAANDIGYLAMLDGDFKAAETLFAEAIRLSPRYYKTAEDNVEELRRRRAEASLAMDR